MRLLPPFENLHEPAEPEPPEGPPADTSLDLLCAVYRDASLPLTTRMRAAIAALPFEHPKLAVVATIPGGNLSARLEAAMIRSGRAIVIDAPPRVIEAQPQPAAD